MKWIKLYENFTDDEKIENHLKNITSTKVSEDVGEILISNLGIKPTDAKTYAELFLKNLSDELVKEKSLLEQSFPKDNNSLVTLYLNSLEKAFNRTINSSVATLKKQVVSGLSKEEFGKKVTPRVVSNIINLVALSVTEDLLSRSMAFNITLKTRVNFYARRIIQTSTKYFYG